MKLNLVFYLVASIFILACSFMCVCAKDKSLRAAGYKVDILGKSGKMSYYKEEESDENKKCKIEMDGIFEKDKDGNNVGKSGQKHSINTFANQDFTFTGPVNATYQDIDCMNINFTSTISGPSAKLDVFMYVFLQDGDLVAGNESFSTSKGAMKFDISLKNWTFCGNGGDDCKAGNKKEIGTQVCFNIVMKCSADDKAVKTGKEAAKPKGEKNKDKKQPKEFDLGGGGHVVMPASAVIDGDTVDLPTAPSIKDISNTKKVFQVCLPRFNSSAFYDPSLTIGDQTSTGNSPISASIFLTIVITLGSFLTSLY